MNDNNIFPTPHVNNNYSNQQPVPNENIALTSPTYSTITPSYAQYSNHHQPQPMENTSSPFGSFNMTTINPSQSEIFSFDIPGFKIIIVPTFSRQDNVYSNYSSDISHITDNQFTQFTQFQQQSSLNCN